MADVGKPGPVDSWLANLFKIPAKTGFVTGRSGSVAPITPAQQGKIAGTQYDIWTAAKDVNPAARAKAVAAATAAATPKTLSGMSSTLNNFKALPAKTPAVPTPKDSAIAKVLGGTSGGGGTAAPATPSFTADMLYQDATSAYQPLIDLYNQQQQQLNERYAANAADIKNIFGNLTTIRAQDKAKIAQQFQTSIEQQQSDLAARTAEARAGVAAGQQGAATAAGEMGTAGQPVPTGSLTAQAAEQGIADSNAYQTTWAALQNVMSQQAQNDVQNAIQGYDYQQTAALETLRNNLEDRLAAIQANMAGTQSQIAQANLAGKQNVLNAKYGEAQTAQANAAKLAQAQASASAAASKPKTYPKTATGWTSKVKDSGFNPTTIQQSIQYAKTLANRAINKNVQAGKEKTATSKQIWDYWLKNNAGAPETALALEYLSLLPK